MPIPRRIELRLEGSREDEGLVLAQDFVTFLEGALDALRKLERVQTGEARRTTVSYRVVELEVGSAVVALEATAPDDFDLGHLVGKFAEGAAAYRDRRREVPGIGPVGDVFSGMMAPLRHGARAIRVAVDGVAVEILADRADAFALAAPQETALVGAVSGSIDAVNVHREPVFYLYPTTGGPRVRCRFDRTHLDDVRAALRRYVTVHGLLGYVEGSPYPTTADVERIERHPPIEKLPTLQSLWGMAPGLTQGLDSVTYVRRMRDAAD